MQQGRLMNEDNQRVKPKVEQDEIRAVAGFNVMLKIRCIEMQLWRQVLIYTCSVSLDKST